MKLGRVRPTHPSPHRALAAYVNPSTLPTPPASVDYSAAAIPVAGQGLQDIAGNDLLGDCTGAELFHQINVWTGNAGTCALPSLAEIVAFYSACSGYVPGDPSTDRGADELTVLQVAKTLGLAGHKIQGAIEVDATSWLHVAAAIWLFGGISICVELPDAWQAGNAPGWTWDLAGSPDPNRGHCFLAYGYDSVGVFVDTWGMVSVSSPTRVTWRALAAYAVPYAGGSAFSMLSQDWLSARGVAPNGLALDALMADAAMVGGAV